MKRLLYVQAAQQRAAGQLEAACLTLSEITQVRSHAQVLRDQSMTAGTFLCRKPMITWNLVMPPDAGRPADCSL